MSRRKYSLEQYQQAHDLVVLEGCTYAEAAEKSGITVTALQRKGRKQDWMDERKAHNASSTEYRSAIFELKLNAVRSALKDKDGDPQKIHALASLERMFPERFYRKDSEDISDRDKREIVVETIEAIVAYLEEFAPSVLYSFKEHLREMAGFVFKKLEVAE